MDKNTIEAHLLAAHAVIISIYNKLINFWQRDTFSAAGLWQAGQLFGFLDISIQS